MKQLRPALWGGVALCAITLSLIHAQGQKQPTPVNKGNTLPSSVEAVIKEFNHQSGHGLDFPDFGFMLPATEYHGRVFQLSQDYPSKLPKMDAGVQKILKIDFRKDWKKYALAVRDYVLQGNIEQPGYDNDFFLEDNKVRKWFHVPWQHWGPQGREGFHGLTQEGPINPQMLAQAQTTPSHAYAVGFYNDLGGYTLGRVWDNPNFPNIKYMAGGQTFPVGTVVGKVLFTTLDASEVPYLKNPIKWQAYVYNCDVPGANSNAQCPPKEGGVREQAPVHLIQMDIMVRDPRAEIGWTFGTFIYNGEVGNQNRWKNLVPVGLQWGNDPEDRTSNSNPTPVKTIINPKLKQTVINTSKDLPATHLGWGSRLNGPVDNPNSSCMSCHSTAQYPGVSAIMPFLNTPAVPIPANGTQASAAWMKWFRNIKAGEAFDKGRAISMDYSLQLQKSIENFLDYQSSINQGQYSIQYWEKGRKPYDNENGNP
ncbi:hypothetical protein [Deinococcus cellulosilyticus]|uniref:Cytochrome c domain-containing protein n=1 Tax=Deinococcus cellulosilyticus (strain DSM 18568 / NBRC 106333 / KACC 11606 / 5516J-15) TaxID=1223518 RepID=A0A511N481_DEIC1|nr:hypothetical protein [Deinococcus cellulosilyticus]GEM47689.1 hypothetical protein DC3_33240 [Deinococcus cellulosilyticus NBRC 106333 = KACC 11606]